MSSSSSSSSSSKIVGNSPAKATNKGEQQQEFSLGLDKDASEHSISSMMSCMSISPKHAENSLRVMESYLHKQQLTDVTLIAGKQSRCFVLVAAICSIYQYDNRQWPRFRIIEATMNRSNISINKTKCHCY